MTAVRACPTHPMARRCTTAGPHWPRCPSCPCATCSLMCPWMLRPQPRCASQLPMLRVPSRAAGCCAHSQSVRAVRGGRMCLRSLGLPLRLYLPQRRWMLQPVGAEHLGDPSHSSCCGRTAVATHHGPGVAHSPTPRPPTGKRHPPALPCRPSHLACTPCTPQGTPQGAAAAAAAAQVPRPLSHHQWAPRGPGP